MPKVNLAIRINSATLELATLEFEKAFIAEFLHKEQQALRLQTLETAITDTLKKVDAAKDAVELQIHLYQLSKVCANWKGAFVERGALDKVHELGWKIDKMAVTLLNMPIYGDYAINLHHSQPLPANAKSLKSFLNFDKGLTSEFIDAVNRDPRFGIAYTSGSGLNNYGHALLFCGEAGFIHINAPIALPRYMSIEQFNHYLFKEEKVLLGMMGAPVTRVNDLLVALDTMCRTTWNWGAIVHNCLTFTHDALKAGGYDVKKQEEFKKHKLKIIQRN